MSIHAEFDALSVDEKVQVVQELWDRIARTPEDLPLPDWHRQELLHRKRMWVENPDPGEDWDQVKESLRDSL